MPIVQEQTSAPVTATPTAQKPSPPVIAYTINLNNEIKWQKVHDIAVQSRQNKRDNVADDVHLQCVSHASGEPFDPEPLQKKQCHFVELSSLFSDTSSFSEWPSSSTDTDVAPNQKRAMKSKKPKKINKGSATAKQKKDAKARHFRNFHDPTPILHLRPSSCLCSLESQACLFL